MRFNYTLMILTVCCFIFSNATGQTQEEKKSSHYQQGEEQIVSPNAGCKTQISQAVIEMEKKRDQKAFRKELQYYLNKESITHREFEIQIHIVRKDDGTGGVDIADVRSEIENYVNPYFVEISASFVECSPPNYINSSKYYSLSGGSEGNSMAFDYNRDNVINIYFVGDPDGACGWARFPSDWPNDYIVIANNCADNQSTLVHEIGHYFDLYHTHETAFGKENVTRDDTDGCYNCESAGDKLCDTEADPRLSKDNINISSSCTYSTDSLFTDPCNNEEYDPDPTFIMSYSRKSCRTVFSDEQYAKMAMTMDNERSYLNTDCLCEQAEAICQDITVNLDGSGNASISADDVDGGSTIDCGTGSKTIDISSFNCSDVGENTVILTVTDSLGWESNCEATVTVEDNNDPAITSFASDLTVECDGLGNTSNYNYWLSNNGGASVFDECGGSWSNNSTGLLNDCGDTGSETVSFTYTDPSGNTATTTATFTIEDTNAPNLVAEMPVGETNMNLCFDDIPEGPTEAEIAALYEDVCGDVSVTKTGSPTGDNCDWTVTYSYVAEDECGNSASPATITYSGGDTEIPSVTCPADIHLPECESVASWTVATSDNCGDLTVVSDPPSGSTFPKGSTTTVNVTVTDECGNENNCSFIVERDPDLEVDIDSLATSSLNTCAYSTGAHIVLGYGGGSDCVTFNATASGGHSPYTYSWDAPDAVPAANFSGSNTATPTFCADFQSDPCVTYTFRVTATDVHGCQETNEIEVNVVNASVFANGSDCALPNNPKVVVCHNPPANGQSPMSLCVNLNAVPHHLGETTGNGHVGDCLGACDAACIYLDPATPEASSPPKPDHAIAEEALAYKIAVSPNPFSSRAEIVISANGDTRAQLAVFDLSGVKVADLYKGDMEKGIEYYFEFNPEHLDSGVYFVKLIGADGSATTEKLVYMK